ncbi:serine/threonine protein kinase [Streptomyces spongiicola]|uniref:non-specific serine/threonine protein kinase n=1 Tax=Streptomyces spongiicola TaxID=1690221 RepID=A0ABM6V8B5_9ACTN|nr:protein kinase [Streptomyces spongiicola]AWK10221.1 serine/threonine protein kinase [Streptomyces spongiicola]
MSQDGARGGRYAGGSVGGGRYRFRDLLGEGGMASVHLAYDTALDRQVAVKTLHTELGREQSFRERFRREAQAVAKLSHPNIVSVFDTGEDAVAFDGSPAGDGMPMPYIVMEYVEGMPLGAVLHEDVRQFGAMPAEKALKVAADVLAALETSHEMGLVHRDIKPGNVMMTKRGVVKVMDFGIARAMQSGVASMTQTGMVVGTPQYLSPEQALGRGVDARSDLYSVGVMLFQLLTGRLPFDAESPLAIVYAHVQEEPAAPSSVNRSVTPAMDALVARAMRKNPNERFPTAAAMRDECLRVASAGGAHPPVIVHGTPTTNSGSGVGSAVFPPVDRSAQGPPPGPHHVRHVQQPYQPGPYGPPAPAPGPGPGPGPGHGPGPGYGYPHQAPAQAYRSPATVPPAYHHSARRAGAPAPSRQGGRIMPVVIGSILVALLAIGGLNAALNLIGGDDGDGDAGPSVTEAAEAWGHRPPERDRTMDAEECSDAEEDTEDPGKVQAPSFVQKDLISVKSCLQAAGWKIKETRVDHPQYAEDQVIEQSPAEGTAVLLGDQTFEIMVASGYPEP